MNNTSAISVKGIRIARINEEGGVALYGSDSDRASLVRYKARREESGLAAVDPSLAVKSVIRQAIR